MKVILLPFCAALLGLAGCGGWKSLTASKNNPGEGPKSPELYTYKGLHFDRRYDDSIHQQLPFSRGVAREIAIRQALADLRMQELIRYTDSINGNPRTKRNEWYIARAGKTEAESRSFLTTEAYLTNTFQRLDSLAALAPISRPTALRHPVKAAAKLPPYYELNRFPGALPDVPVTFPHNGREESMLHVEAQPYGMHIPDLLVTASFQVLNNKGKQGKNVTFKVRRSGPTMARLEVIDEPLYLNVAGATVDFKLAVAAVFKVRQNVVNPITPNGDFDVSAGKVELIGEHEQLPQKGVFFVYANFYIVGTCSPGTKPRLDLSYVPLVFPPR